MAGGAARYLDNLIKGLKTVGDPETVRALISGIYSELDVALKSSDSGQLDTLIRRLAENGSDEHRALFNNTEFVTGLRSTRSRYQFQNAFESAVKSNSPVDIEQLRRTYGLAADDPSVKVAEEFVATRSSGRAGSGSTEDRLAALEQGQQSLRRRDVLNFVGRYNELMHKVANKAGPFKGVVLFGHNTLLWSSAALGVGATAVGVAGVAHLATDGESTRGLTRMAESALTSMYHGLKNIAPGLAEYLKQKTPEMTRFAYTALTLNTNMIKTSLEELDRTHNLGIGANSGALASVIEGNIVMAAFQKVTGVEVGAADVERIMRGAMNEPDKKAYIAREFSRLSGKAESEFAEALASPEVFDISGMTPEQIRDMFGQTVPVTPSGASPSATAPATAAAAPSLMDRARTALHRRTEQVRGAAQNTVEQAAETVRIGRLSGSALNEEFNRVAESKNLNWFSSPQMFFIKQMDSIGFDFFGLNNMLKKQVLLDNVKTQFGDQFGFSRQANPSLNLDPAPAPGS